jgi:hypothetical protein
MQSLQSTKVGGVILNSYKANQSLSSAQQNFVAKTVAEFYVANIKYNSIRLMKQFTHKITQLFPTESQVSVN